MNYWNQIGRPNVLIGNGHFVQFTPGFIDVLKEKELPNDNRDCKAIVIPFDGTAMDCDLRKTGAASKSTLPIASISYILLSGFE